MNLIYAPQARPPPPYFPKSDDRPRFSPASRVYRLPRFISSSRSVLLAPPLPRITVEYRWEARPSPPRLFFSNEWIPFLSLARPSTFFATFHSRELPSNSIEKYRGCWTETICRGERRKARLEKSSSLLFITLLFFAPRVQHLPAIPAPSRSLILGLLQLSTRQWNMESRLDQQCLT